MCFIRLSYLSCMTADDRHQKTAMLKYGNGFLGGFDGNAVKLRFPTQL